MSLGIYLHVPFCKQKCPYCDFYSLCDLSLKEQYVDALVKAIEFYSDKKRVVDSVYFGGGTPSLLSVDEIGKILQTIKCKFNLKSPEITLEANPSSVSTTFFEGILKAGVNRLSLGVQSFNDQELSLLGRLHDKEKAETAIKTAKEVGFENISADLMIGVSNQTKESLINSIEKLSKLEVNHVSSYLLKIEKDTPYFKMEDSLNLPDDDEMANLYLLAVETLKKYGYQQYEISNFSKNGVESRHNLKYWKLEDYLGIGPSAHSFLEGKRFYYNRNLNEFIKGTSPLPDGEGGSEEERVMLALRLAEGLKIDFTPTLAKKCDLLSKCGLLNMKDGFISLTDKGMLLSNSIITEILECIK